MTQSTQRPGWGGYEDNLRLNLKNAECTVEIYEKCGGKAYGKGDFEKYVTRFIPVLEAGSGASDHFGKDGIKCGDEKFFFMREIDGILFKSPGALLYVDHSYSKIFFVRAPGADRGCDSIVPNAVSNLMAYLKREHNL